MVKMNVDFQHKDVVLPDDSEQHEFMETMDREKDAHEIALQYLVREADYEEERRNSFDSRAGIAIAFLSVLLVAFVKIDEFPVLVESAFQSKIFILLYTLYVVFYILEIITLIWAIWGFIGIININTFERVDADDVNNYRNEERIQLINGICDIITQNIQVNAKINNQIAMQFKNSLKRIKLSVVIALLSFISYLLLICLGVGLR